MFFLSLNLMHSQNNIHVAQLRRLGLHGRAQHVTVLSNTGVKCTEWSNQCGTCNILSVWHCTLTLHFSHRNTSNLNSIKKPRITQQWSPSTACLVSSRSSTMLAVTRVGAAAALLGLAHVGRSVSGPFSCHMKAQPQLHVLCECTGCFFHLLEASTV